MSLGLVVLEGKLFTWTQMSMLMHTPQVEDINYKINNKKSESDECWAKYEITHCGIFDIKLPYFTYLAVITDVASVTAIFPLVLETSINYSLKQEISYLL